MYKVSGYIFCDENEGPINIDDTPINTLLKLRVNTFEEAKQLMTDMEVPNYLICLDEVS